MYVKEWVASWMPDVEAIMADAEDLKQRFEALYGDQKMRPDKTNWNDIAQNVININTDFYRSLFSFVYDPYNTYGESENHTDKDTHSGDDVTTIDDNAVRTLTETPGVTDTNTLTHGLVVDSTTTPTGTRQTDVFDYAYNSTSASQPDNRTTESFNNYKEVDNVKNSGADVNELKHSGTNTSESRVDGDVTNTLKHGEVIDNNGESHKKGYNLKDSAEAIQMYYNAYDRLCSDIHRAVCVLVATGDIDFSLDW